MFQRMVQNWHIAIYDYFTCFIEADSLNYVLLKMRSITKNKQIDENCSEHCFYQKVIWLKVYNTWDTPKKIPLCLLCQSRLKITECSEAGAPQGCYMCPTIVLHNLLLHYKVSSSYDILQSSIENNCTVRGQLIELISELINEGTSR